MKTNTELKMILCSFLLFLGRCELAIVHLGPLQMDIRSQLQTHRDLLKTQMVDKNWVSFDNVFKKIIYNELFEHKQTNKNRQSAILHSKNLQMDISSQLPTPRDLMKTRLVDKRWIGVEKFFQRITPNAGLFENRDTNKIIFETKEKSMLQIEMELKMFIPLKGRDWDGIFAILLMEANWLQWWNWLQGEKEFLKALAEIVDVSAGRIGKFQGTAIHTAVNYWHDNDLHEILLILLKRPDANPNFKNTEGHTALHYAAVLNNSNLIEILLKYGAEIDETDWKGRTPLMITAWGRNYRSMEVLLKHKANPNLRDNHEKTAFEYLDKASHKNKADFVEILLKYGANKV